MIDTYEAMFASPMTEPLPEWAMNLAIIHVAVLAMVAIGLCLCISDSEQRVVNRQLEVVLKRLEGLEQLRLSGAGEVLEITQELPPPGARGRAGRSVSHVLLRRV